MAKLIARAMAIAIGVCHVRDMAHSTPLQTTAVAKASCGVSGQGLHACSGGLPDAMRGYAAEFGGGF